MWLRFSHKTSTLLFQYGFKAALPTLTQMGLNLSQMICGDYNRIVHGPTTLVSFVAWSLHNALSITPTKHSPIIFSHMIGDDSQ